MQDFRQEINARASLDLEQRRTWYSPVADVYYNARPHYPKELIDQSVALAQLSSDASILEVGCGPGNATVAFAEFGFSMTCIEPNQDFCQKERQKAGGRRQLCLRQYSLGLNPNVIVDHQPPVWWGLVPGLGKAGQRTEG